MSNNFKINKWDAREQWFYSDVWPQQPDYKPIHMSHFTPYRIIYSGDVDELFFAQSPDTTYNVPQTGQCN